MSKYNNKKVEFNGIKFDSLHEAQYYKYLLESKDVIEIDLQPKFELLPSFTKDNKNHRSITYTPDFKVTYSDGSIVYIDVKGMETQQGNMRRKMFDYKYPELTLKWISKSVKFGVDGWIDYDELKKIRRENKKNK